MDLLRFLCCSPRSDLRFLPPPTAPSAGSAVVLQLFYFQRVRPQGFRFHFSLPRPSLPPKPQRPGAERKKKKNTLQILFHYGGTSGVNTGAFPVPQGWALQGNGAPSGVMDDRLPSRRGALAAGAASSSWRGFGGHKAAAIVPSINYYVQWECVGHTAISSVCVPAGGTGRRHWVRMGRAGWSPA